MPIRDELAGLSGLQRRRLKARRLAEHAAPRLPITWQLGNGPRAVAITISAVSFDGEALRLRVEAQRGSWLMADDVVVINPPIMTPTGQMVPNPDGGMMNAYEENAAGAIRSVVEDVVRGWEAA